MADPLSVGAGAIGIIAFVQGAVTQVNSLVGFYRQVKNAPRDAQNAFEEVDLLQFMLSCIADDMNCALLLHVNRPISFAEPLGKATPSYGLAIQRLESTISDFQKLISRKWGSTIRGRFQFVMGKEKLEGSRSHLQHHISILGIEQRNFYEVLRRYDQHRNVVCVEQILAATISYARTLPVFSLRTEAFAPKRTGARTSKTTSKASKISRSLQFGFGSVTVHHYNNQELLMREYDSEERVIAERDGDSLSEIHFRFQPCLLAQTYNLSWSRKQGLSTFQFRIRNVIHRDHVSFELIRNGDLIGLKELLNARKASIHDVTAEGYSLLHSAAAHFHPEMCQFLLDPGVDADATYREYFSERDDKLWTPLHEVLCMHHHNYACRRFAWRDFDDHNTRLARVIRLLLQNKKEMLETDFPYPIFRYNGPFETYNLLFRQAQYDWGLESESLTRQSDHLRFAVKYLVPESFVHRFDDAIALAEQASELIIHIIKSGASVHGNRLESVRTRRTPLLDRLSLDSPTFTEIYVPLASAQGRDGPNVLLCQNCMFRKEMNAPPVDEWLDVLREADVNLISYVNEECALWMAKIDDKLNSSLTCLGPSRCRISHYCRPFVRQNKYERIQHTGTFWRNVTFETDPSSDWKLRISLGETWAERILNKPCCFCYRENGERRCKYAIMRAEKTRWMELGTYEDLVSPNAETETPLVKMPGSWVDEQQCLAAQESEARIQERILHHDDSDDYDLIEPFGEEHGSEREDTCNEACLTAWGLRAMKYSLTISQRKCVSD